MRVILQLQSFYYAKIFIAGNFTNNAILNNSTEFLDATWELYLVATNALKNFAFKDKYKRFSIIFTEFALRKLFLG